MEVEIVSRECIKPTSPTPHHLRTYKLSFLDQFIPSNYVPMILFYPVNHGSNHNDVIPKRSQVLKQSLSQTLTRFYPLAGKIKDDLSIDCNDEGAYYVEARINRHLSEFLNQPDISLFHRFLPCDPSWNQSTVGAHAAMIQVNIFDCGGIAIGAYVLHRIVDGIAISTFLKDWAATARGSCEAVPCPDFSAPSLFPQNDSLPKDSTLMAMWTPFFKTGKAITRRFVFDASAIASLKAKATSSWVQNPTRVEVVSGLIWKCTMAAFKAKSGFQKPSLLSHAVNMRRRAVPPLSEYSMGNFIWLAVAQCAAEVETKLHHLVRELREAISKISCDFLKTLEGDGGFVKFCEALREMGGVFSSNNNGVDFLGFTSWVNLGLFEVDFGWGKPVWATSVGSGNSESVYMNFVLLMDTRWGDGVEAWVTLEEQDMAILERDMELLAFASLDPSPLQLGIPATPLDTVKVTAHSTLVNAWDKPDW